jgi:hypothetical protein
MLSEKDSEALIINFRTSLNKHVSSKKNPDVRNACIMNITRNNGVEQLRSLYACLGMGQWHTEPRLV